MNLKFTNPINKGSEYIVGKLILEVVKNIKGRKNIEFEFGNVRLRNRSKP